MALAIPIGKLTVFSKDNPPYRDFDFQSGSILLVNKEKGWSSFDAVKYLRNVVQIKKIGHAGTLDPMATGLLVICTGKATKSISQIQELPKTYRAEITFGSSTVSFDAMDETDETAPFGHITLEHIEQVMNDQFLGEIEQVPPKYSALKRGGKRMYDLARKGIEVEMFARPVTIHSFNILNFNSPKLEIEISCSKGTYIRSIAHDLGIALDSRAHLTALERTFIGDYSSEVACTPSEFSDLMRENG